MDASGIRLGVDAGAVASVGVLCWPDGRWQPLEFDGLPLLPSAVGVGSDGALVTGSAARVLVTVEPGRVELTPIRRIADGELKLGTTTVEAVDLVAASLRRLRDEAGSAGSGLPLVEVCLVVPAGWGPRRRTLLRRAAHRAGLAEPTLIDAPVGVAQHLLTAGVTVQVGWWLVVCDIGAGFTASVLRRHAGGFEMLATFDADAGGLRVDEILSDHVLATAMAAVNPASAAAAVGEASATAVSAAQRATLLATVAVAKESLAAAGAVTVPVPGGRPAVVLTAADLHTLTMPVWAMAAAAARNAIDAADLDQARCAGVFCVGGGAQLPAAAPGLAAELGMAVAVAPQPKLAAVLGAVHAGTPRAASGAGATPTLPLPPVRRVLGVLAPALLSLAMFAQFMATGDLNRVQGNDTLTYLLANWGELGMASLFALLACLNAAAVVSPLISTPTPWLGSPASRAETAAASTMRTPGEVGQQVGSGALAAVAVGLAVAGMYSIVGAVSYGMATGPFLAWALWSTAPVAAVAAVTAVLAMRHTGSPSGGWLAFLHMSNVSIACAGVGMLSMEWFATAAADRLSVLTQVLAVRVGGGLVGVGAALLVVPSPRFRIVLAAPLGVFTAAIAGSHATIKVIATVYVAAVTLWWAQRAWWLIRAQLATRRRASLT